EDVWRNLRKSDQAAINHPMPENVSPAQRIESPGPAVAPRPPATSSLPVSYSLERLRDYVAAFLLAGLDPQLGSETEFFADRRDRPNLIGQFSSPFSRDPFAKTGRRRHSL